MEQFITAVSGPLGALALSVAILWWLANKIVPVLQKYLEGQNEKLGALIKALEKTVEAHEADRDAFENSIAGLVTRIDKVETDVHHIRSRLP